MDVETVMLIVGGLSGLTASLVTIIKVGSAAYQAAIDRAAKQIENQRLADQAKATVEAKNQEIEALKAAYAAKAQECEGLAQENARLWDMIPQKEGLT